MRLLHTSIDYGVLTDMSLWYITLSVRSLLTYLGVRIMGPLNSEGAFQESGQPLAAISCPNVLSLCAGAFNDIATSHFDENCATQ